MTLIALVKTGGHVQTWTESQTPTKTKKMAWQLLPARPPIVRTETYVVNDTQYAEMGAFRNECEKEAADLYRPTINDTGLLQLFTTKTFRAKNIPAYAAMMFLDAPSQYAAIDLMHEHVEDRKRSWRGHPFHSLAEYYIPAPPRDGYCRPLRDDLCLPIRGVNAYAPPYVLMALLSLCDDFIGRVHIDNIERVFVVTLVEGYPALLLPTRLTMQLARHRMYRLCCLDEDDHHHPYRWHPTQALSPPMCYAHLRASLQSPVYLPFVIGEQRDRGYACAVRPDHLVPLKRFMDAQGLNSEAVLRLCVDLRRFCDLHEQSIESGIPMEPLKNVVELNRPCLRDVHTALMHAIIKHRLSAVRDLRRACAEMTHSVRHQIYPILTWSTRCVYPGPRALVPAQTEENPASMMLLD